MLRCASWFLVGALLSDHLQHIDLTTQVCCAGTCFLYKYHLQTSVYQGVDAWSVKHDNTIDSNCVWMFPETRQHNS